MPSDQPRRTFLKTSVPMTVIIAGCLSTPSDTTQSGDPRQGPPRTTPQWLHENVECESMEPPEDGPHKTSLTLDSVADELRSSVPSIGFESLSSDTRMVVAFAVDHGSAETCVYPPPDPFRELADRIRDIIVTAEKRPEHVYIEKGTNYYDISFQSADAVYI